MKILLPLFAIVFLTHNTSAQNWDEQADVPVNLSFPVVVELNGYIHVMGGGTGQGATGYHTRFDPANNIWETMEVVPYLAQQPAGAVVNGKIHYCGGGYPNSGTPLNDHYYYDPSLDEWFEAADLPTARVIHEAVELGGKLYVMSGQPDKDRFDVYDPGNDSWTQLNDLPDDNFWYGAIVATDNTIYRFGGGGYLGPQSLAHEYDLLNDEWISIPSLPMGLHAPAGVAVNNLLICITGGYNLTNLDASWLYNTGTQAYYSTDGLPEERSYHSLAIADGCIYCVGGYNMDNEDIGVDMLKNCEISATNVTGNKEDMSKPYDVFASWNSFRIDVHQEVVNDNLGIQLIDMTGRVVRQEVLAENTGCIIFSSEGLSTGMYLVNIVIGNRAFVEEWLVTR